MAVIDKTGNKYGKLTVIGWSHSVYRSPRNGSYQFWLCKCECGNETVVVGNSLTKGNTTSCGCASSRRATPHYWVTHGKSRSATYKTWCGMRERCNLPNHISFKYYGARGVKVCERWMSFENFLSDMGEKPDGLTLDRIDPFGDYEPDNCRWADAKTQSANTRKAAAARKGIGDDAA